MLEINKIYNESCLDGLKKITNNCCNIIVTSPPYKNSDNYSEELIYNCFSELYRVLKSNSLFFLNFGHLKEDKFRPFRVCQIALECGFKLSDTITWIKNHFTPLNGNKNLNNLTEFIFILYKGEMPNLNRLSIGVSYQDLSNAKRYNNGLNLRCGGNVWYINIPTITNKSQRLHKDEFPLELPLKCIKLSGIKSGILLDPFAGSATACLAAKQLGLDYIGFEKNKDYYDISNKRLGLI
jgi:site-specific DNA-methyltransferase (adenine-specific)